MVLFSHVAVRVASVLMKTGINERKVVNRVFPS
jgi:hypothetical protein